ncbi:MAG: hypothetical protein MUO52_02595 [Desulfobacterales bacterium]|nr:hypothetical protein [Desulfobacterales bacterium]
MEDLRLYCDEMEAQLKDWDAKFERLKVKARSSEGETELEIKDEIHFLDLKKRAVEANLRELRVANGETCQLLKEDMKEAMSDLEHSFQEAVSKFR